ncbi:MAG: hypothetical protein CVU73_15785 [Deltaproteobacteria bacterium HGW-Deltaproteobacteria-8]|jgi:hypothetical protein|nr:MAG: hypothetical protein CVU73_15785 [Deltaproteobacteria bacterium HGW-Deltaproteobacteria-8]
MQFLKRFAAWLRDHGLALLAYVLIPIAWADLRVRPLCVAVRERMAAFVAWLRRGLRSGCSALSACAKALTIWARGSCSAAATFARSVIAWLRRRGPRLGVPTALGHVLLLVVWIVAPHQAPVIIYKLAGIMLAGCDGYLFHRTVSPYAQPSGYLKVKYREELGFKAERADFEVVEGCERLFIHANWQRAAYVLVPMLALAWML